MKLALCDDDRELVRNLKPIIYQYANSHRFEMVIDVFYCGEDLLKSKTVYDMIFLDLVCIVLSPLMLLYIAANNSTSYVKQ